MEQRASIVWTTEAFERYQQLPTPTRDLIALKLEKLAVYPQMYQVEQLGKWEGLRRAIIGKHKLFYSYWHSTHTIYIETVDLYPI